MSRLRSIIRKADRDNAARRWEQAAAGYTQALAIDPGYTRVRYVRGAMRYWSGDDEGCVEDMSAVIAADPTNADAWYGRGQAWLRMGDLRRGFAGYEARWDSSGWESRRNSCDIPVPLWLGEESIAGKSILVYTEQGLGDAIQFSRFLPLLREAGATVLLACDPALASLFAPLVHRVVGSAPVGRVDYRVPLMSLPYAFGTTLDTIPPAPYLDADPERGEHWRNALGPRVGRRIGIAWSGRPTHADDRSRSLPERCVRPLLDLTGIEWVSVQRGTLPGVRSFDLQDFADTAALMQHLDLVISVDTAPAHLAGTLGIPTWILLPFVPDWRWLRDREDSPWYPSVRLFRQPRRGDWESVIERVVSELWPDREKS